MRVILSIIIWGAAAVLTILVFFSVLFLTILLFPFDRKRKLCHAQGFWWADALISLNPFWNLKISGLENIDAHKAYVMIANHQSLADIVVVYRTHLQFKWVAKNSLFKIPVFGWTMLLMKYIKLSRGEFGSIKRVYEEAASWLRKDISILFFPEGTRSETDQMNTFKNGAFKLAIKEKKSVLPIYISGTRDLIPKGGWIFKRRASCRLKVLPSVDTTDFKPEDFSRLKDIVREKLINASLN